MDGGEKKKDCKNFVSRFENEENAFEWMSCKNEWYLNTSKYDLCVKRFYS